MMRATHKRNPKLSNTVNIFNEQTIQYFYFESEQKLLYRRGRAGTNQRYVLNILNTGLIPTHEWKLLRPRMKNGLIAWQASLKKYYWNVKSTESDSLTYFQMTIGSLFDGLLLASTQKLPPDLERSHVGLTDLFQVRNSDVAGWSASFSDSGGVSDN